VVIGSPGVLEIMSLISAPVQALGW
jgi:hypothetical protein